MRSSPLAARSHGSGDTAHLPQKGSPLPGEFVFRQLFERESSTYTYLLGDTRSGEAVLIDGVLETVERDEASARELGLRVAWVVDTHVHADHVTGAGAWRDRFGAKTAVGAGSGVECADRLLADGDEVPFGRFRLKAIATPGHTSACVSYLCEGRVFTGDALLIRGCGRTDFQGGSAERLFESVRARLFSLPDETLVYPGHDYNGRTCSSIFEERRWNARLAESRTREEFIAIMANLKLADPKKIAEALPANLACGRAGGGTPS